MQKWIGEPCFIADLHLEVIRVIADLYRFLFCHLKSARAATQLMVSHYFTRYFKIAERTYY